MSDLYESSVAGNTGSFPHYLAQANFEFANGQLAVESRTAEELVEQFGSPLFVYSAGRMRSTLDALRHATHDGVDIYYSVKANPNPAVIAVFGAMGAGAEIASGTEYEFAVAAGVPRHRILFAGPGKSSAELRHVIAGGIGEIHAEATDELDRIAAIGSEYGRPVDISIRVNPTSAAQGGSMRMGGKSAQFGIDEESLNSLCKHYDNNPFLNIVGVHLFAGTQVLDARVLLTQWRHGVSVARKLAELLNRPLKTIDLGGGLGIPYHSNEQELDLSILYEEFPAILSDIRSDPLLSAAKIIVEPGRYLVGPSGVYLSSAVSVKTSRDIAYMITDGGMNHNLAASGNLGQVIKRDYPLLMANRALAPHDTPAIVVGPLCTPLDTYGRKSLLPSPRVGDIVAILQSGAYGLTASPFHFLSQPGPAEVLLDNGSRTIIRQRGTFTNPYPGMSFLEPKCNREL